MRRAFDVLAKIRQRNLGWLARRLLEELRTPSTPPGKVLRRMSLLVERMLLRLVPGVRQRQTLWFFLDLDISPVTFDVLTFLAGAEMERRRRHLRDLHVVVVPGRVGGLRAEPADYQSVLDLSARQWRVREILLPALAMLPTCSGYTLCSSRQHALAIRSVLSADIYPLGYSPLLPISPDHRRVRDEAAQGLQVWPLLTASEQSLRYIRAWRAQALDRKLVVITLRQYDFHPRRNSNLSAWAAFADRLDPNEYQVVFVPDTEHALLPTPPELQGRVLFVPAAWNLQLRMALYQEAWINLAVSSGPMELAWYNQDCRYIIFMKVNAAPQQSVEALLAQGFTIGADFSFATRFQHWAWEDDELPAIMDAFRKLDAELRLHLSS